MMKMKTRAMPALIIGLIMVVLAAVAPARPALAAPSISISPSSGAAGTAVLISGASFSSYAGDRLSVFFDNIRVISDGVAVSGGSIPQMTLLVPENTLPGNHVISIKDSSGIVLAQSQFYVAQKEIVLDKWSSTVGSIITVSCIGFHAGKEVTIQYYSTEIPETLTTQPASNAGECTLQFTVTASTTGSHKIVANNALGETAETYLEITPSLKINLPIANIGDKINILGTGFAGNDEVDIQLHGTNITFAQVSDRGSFVAVFYVPVIKAGMYSIAIEDSSQVTRWIDFTIAAKITLGKTTGEVGLKLQVDGTGFDVGSLAKINYDNEEMTAVTVDDNGAFSFYFDVPVSLAGAHIITVTDGINTKQAVFTVESEAPPVPEIYVPKPRSMVGAQATFAWGSVYDPSEPVAYTLQISRTKDFVQPVLEKKGLSFSEYTLGTKEALLPNRQFTYYYWRVRATDSASNDGLWSDAVAFQVKPSNTLPQWTDYVLIGFGILLAIMLASRIRKATKSVKTVKET